MNRTDREPAPPPRRPLTRRSRAAAAALPALAAVASLAALAASAAATTQPVGWFRLPPGCTHFEGDDLTEMRCGAFGRFLFGADPPPRAPDCAGGRFGYEAPAAYPAPADSPPASALTPCDDGRCFDAEPGQPHWAAVVDWNDAHGWTVGETLLQASDRRVRAELFDLERPDGLLPSWLDEVGDAHVLAQLCTLAERLAAPGAAPPLVLNLSFGRLPKAPAGVCPESGQGTLECEVRAVLGHLGAAHGVLPVAAAGNHGLLLFPADDAGVVAAGALDLARLGATGEVRPSRETPPAAEALVAGYGIYLASGQEPTGFWPAPPGSSYAAALLSGWIAGTLVAHPSPAAPSGAWWPLPLADGWALTRNGKPLPGSDLQGPSEILAAALGARPAVCAGGPAETAVVRLAESPPPALPQLSLAQLTGDENGKLPGSVICVPCHDGGLGGMTGEGGQGLRVDLSRGAPLPAAYTPTGLYLQVGAALHALDRSQDPALLLDLARGELGLLVFEEVEAPAAVQVSLVYTLRYGEKEFWHAEPVHVHLHGGPEP